MDIDLSILRMLEREKEISFEVLADAIEQALLIAYQRTAEAQQQARVVLDRKTGHVTVFAAELDEDGNKVSEYDDTPEGFGRIAATTAKQVMLQRLRDAEDELKFGEFAGKEGDIISGIIQQGRNPDDVMVDLGKIEALLPVGSECRGSPTSMASASNAWWSRCARACVAHRSPSRAATRAWSASCSRWRCPRSPMAPWRLLGLRARPATAPRSRFTPRSPASTPRVRASDLSDSACAT